jgi:uncharacterized protein HemY
MEVEHIPGKFLANPDDRETLERFLKSSNTGNTGNINATRIEAQIYLASTLQNSSDKISSALVKAANASEKHARNLTRATWALVFATCMLVIMAIMQLIYK